MEVLFFFLIQASLVNLQFSHYQGSYGLVKRAFRNRQYRIINFMSDG